MPEYLDDPSVLTKDKLKSELLAHNVELPSGNPTKDVYVQLYLKNLTAQNKKHVTATTLDAFSSDEELPPPVVYNRSRSSGRVSVFGCFSFTAGAVFICRSLHITEKQGGISLGNFTCIVTVGSSLETTSVSRRDQQTRIH